MCAINVIRETACTRNAFEELYSLKWNTWFCSCYYNFFFQTENGFYSVAVTLHDSTQIHISCTDAHITYTFT
jgi:hypothetical protein